MTDDLIERLREAANRNYRQAASDPGVVTCERSRARPPKNQPGWCLDVERGHQCRWSNETHVGRHKHRCECGEEWGEGVSAD